MNLGNLGRQTFAAPLAALTLVAGGGIALAASGGADPVPQAVEHRQVGKPSVDPTARPTDKPTDKPTAHPGTDASPSPSLTGLCKAYRAGGYASSTKNGRVNPAWAALESAAGGAGDIDVFCDETLAAEAADKAERKANDDDDVKPEPGKPTKDPKPVKVHDNNDAGDSDDADDSDDQGDEDDEDGKGSRSSGHGKH